MVEVVPFHTGALQTVASRFIIDEQSCRCKLLGDEPVGAGVPFKVVVRLT
jgi:hypothetical protein